MSQIIIALTTIFYTVPTLISTLAIYLIHNNPLISNWLWNTVVQADMYFDSLFFLLHMITMTLIIFTICSLLELLRVKMSRHIL